MLAAMGHARASLLDSAYSFPAYPENRLTELVATVTASCSALCGELFALAGLPVGDRYTVITQADYTLAGKPDMVIEAFRGGALVSRLWFEHKIDARDQPGQRERYAAALAAGPAPGALLYIVADAERARRPGAGLGLTWQHLGEMADRVGVRAWGRSGGRSRWARKSGRSGGCCTSCCGT